MALAVIERAGDQRHRAVGLEADAAHFLVRRRGDFEIRADAEPAQLAALLAFAPAGREALHVGGFERILEHAGEIAAVICHVGGGIERDLRGADVVLLAQRNPVDAHLGGRGIDQPLHIIVALGPAGAAIGGHECGVGEHALGRDLEQRCPVDTGCVLHCVERGHQRRDHGEIAAHIAVTGQAHGEKVAVLVERELGRHLVVAAVMVGHE